jgi:type II secretory pathway pseudopilin PulG
MFKAKPGQRTQKGYMLLAVMIMVTLMLIALSAEAPRIAQQIQREKEEELVHRGQEYARAIKKFYHKQGTYPTSVDQLLDTNHIRFLRKKYKDPITGEDEWHLVHAGEAEIKIPQNVGSVQGSTNPGLSGGTFTSSGQGATPNGQAGTNPNATGLSSSGLSSGTSGLSGGTPQGGQGGNVGSLQTNNIGNGPTIGGGAIIGVASVSKKSGIKQFNDTSEYDQWLFVFDPRLEQASGATAGAAGGVVASANAGITVAAPRASGSGVPGLNPSPTPAK